MKPDLNEVSKWFERRNLHLQIYDGYADRNPDSGAEILSTNWNDVPKKMRDFLESHFEIVWDDEYVSCDHCSRAVRVVHDSYGWEAPFLRTDSEIVCKKCIKDNPEWLEEFIEDYKNTSKRALPSWTMPLLKNAGFVCFEQEDGCARFESGWHPGQTDDPVKILEELEREFPEAEVVFVLTGVGQFDVNFTAFIRYVMEEH